MHYYSLLQRSLVMLLITLTFIPCSYAQETEMSDGFCIVLPADVSVVPWPLARDQLPDAQPGKMYLLNKDNSFIAIKTHSKPIVEKDRDLNKLVSVLAPMIAAQNPTIKFIGPEFVDLSGTRFARIHGSGVQNDGTPVDYNLLVTLLLDHTTITLTICLKGAEGVKRVDEMNEMIKTIRMSK